MHFTSTFCQSMPPRDHCHKDMSKRARPDDGSDQNSHRSRARRAVIDLNLDSSDEKYLKLLRPVREDSNVSAIVLNFLIKNYGTFLDFLDIRSIVGVGSASSALYSGLASACMRYKGLFISLKLGLFTRLEAFKILEHLQITWLQPCPWVYCTNFFNPNSQWNFPCRTRRCCSEECQRREDSHDVHMTCQLPGFEPTPNHNYGQWSPGLRSAFTLLRSIKLI